MRVISCLTPVEQLPRQVGVLAALTMLAVLAACGGGQVESVDLASPAHAPPNMSALDSADGSDAIAPIPPAPGTLRQVYVLPSSPVASDANDGSFDAPLLTIGQAMKILRPGDDIVVGPGVYRETVEVPPLPLGRDTFIRALTRYSATIKGSDLVGDWSLVSSDTWFHEWLTEQPEQVFRDGKPLKQIAGTVFNGYPLDPKSGLDGLRPPAGIWPSRVEGDQTTMSLDSFYYSASERRLYVRLSTPLRLGEQLEVSMRTYVLRALQAADLVIDGFNFEHSNTSLTQRHGAIYIKGNRSTFRNSAVRYMDSFCVMLNGDDLKILASTISYCGQVGISVNGARATISNNTVSYNNYRGFDLSWESGGMKFTGSPALANSTISSNKAQYNNGDGIWMDSTPHDVVIENNTLAYNAGHGVHFEASKNGNIRNNTAYGNGKRGIYLLESSGTSISSNIAFANYYQGIAIATGVRYPADPVAYGSFGNSITSNTVAWNDPKGNRLQFVLPGLEFANTSDRNVSHAGDVVPRYSEGWPSPTNPYKSGLAAWRPFSGQDWNSVESWGPMPSSLADALAAKKLLTPSDLPPLLLTAGVR